MVQEHIEKLSHRRAFKRVNKKHVLDVLRRHEAKTVLDVGCGVGNTLKALVELGFDAYGVTVNPDEIKASTVPDRIRLGDVQKAIEMPGAPFDAAICFDCLEHLENPLAALRNINAVLRNGAPFICYIPPEKWTECDYHVIVYSPRQMKWLLNLTGFRLQSSEGRFGYRGKGVTYFTTRESDGQLEPGTIE